VQNVFAYLAIAATGAFGWFALEFIGRPIRSFFDLRLQIRQQMLFLANVSVPEQELYMTYERRQEYNQELVLFSEMRRTVRELGSKMLAFGESEWWANQFLNAVGYDAAAAGSALIGFSNSVAEYGEDRAKFRADIAKELRFKY
jgi:hypothetical protein